MCATSIEERRELVSCQVVPAVRRADQELDAEEATNRKRKKKAAAKGHWAMNVHGRVR